MLIFPVDDVFDSSVNVVECGLDLLLRIVNQGLGFLYGLLLVS